MKIPVKNKEYVLNGNWCVVEKVDDEGVHLYFGTHSSVYSLEYFMKRAKTY